MTAATFCNPPSGAPSLEHVCREISMLREELLRARTGLTPPGYHLDLDGCAAEKAAQFLQELPGRVLKLQRLIARHRGATSREDFDDALIALGMLRREPKLLFAVAGRQWHQALLLPSELLAVAVVEGNHQPLRKKPC